MFFRHMVGIRIHKKCVSASDGGRRGGGRRSPDALLQIYFQVLFFFCFCFFGLRISLASVS